MSTVAIIMAGTTLVVLYRPALHQQHERLLQEAMLHSQLFSTLLASDSSLDQQQRLEQALTTLALAYASSGGDISRYEIIIGKQMPSGISYILKLNGNQTEDWLPPERSMHKALHGLVGIAQQHYDDDKRSLEAYQPIHGAKLGIVVRINMHAFEKPYIRAGIIAATVGLILLAIAVLIAITIGNPIIKLAEAHSQQLKTIMDTVVDAIITTDARGRILQFNPAAQHLFGYTAQEIIDKEIEVLMAPEQRERHVEYLQDYLLHKNQRNITGLVREITARRKDGSIFAADIAIGEAVINKQHFFTASIRDIGKRKEAELALKNHQVKLEEQVAARTAELKAANQQLSQLASIDGLTGIANRRVFDAVLKRELRRSKRLGIPLSLLFCDIDFFKKYNDTYGHPAGDDCLRQVAQTIKDSFLRAGELSARYGGEEFAVILPAVGAQEANTLANKLCEAVTKLYIKHESSDAADIVTLSIGVASTEDGDLNTPDDLVQRADQALYSAKSLGRNRVEPALAA